jgi:hypothetical protein
MAESIIEYACQVPQLLRGGLAEEGLGEVLGGRGGYRSGLGGVGLK